VFAIYICYLLNSVAKVELQIHFLLKISKQFNLLMTAIQMPDDNFFPADGHQHARLADGCAVDCFLEGPLMSDGEVLEHMSGDSRL
jgi:hypothetical protein